jgi:two-component system, LuxR family, sensor kinase FixL
MPRKLRVRARRSATSALLPIATAALAASIFVTDLLTPPDTAIAVLYVTVVLMAARFCRPRGVVLVAAGCFGLTALCYFLSAENAFDTAVSTLALGLTTFLALQSQSSAASLRDQASLLDLTHDAIIARRFDDDAITYWNRDAEELYGWDRAEAVGRVAHELVKTTYPLPLDQIKTELLRVGRFEGEFVNKRRDGTPVVVTSRWSLQRDRHGRPAVILVTSNDITERKRAEAEARERERRSREMQMELEHANRIATMGQLTASIAHEVNQPIATARNNAASALRFLCRSPPDLEEVREALACIVNDVDRAGDVIGGIRKLITKAPTPRDDCLDITRRSAG